MVDCDIAHNLINVFKTWFRNKESHVLWNNNVSNYFEIRSDVPQGSILSGKFFNMLLDKLLCVLDNSGFGCCINTHFAGASAYADDIMSALLIQLQKMLYICSCFGKACD